MNPEDNYFIKPGYQASPGGNVTYEKIEGQYWTKGRIRMAAHYQYQVYLEARKLAQNKELSRVIDLGCGPATKLMELLDPVCSRIVGIDQDSAIQICKQKYQNVEFYQEDLENPVIDLKSLKLENCFDLVIAADVIEHLETPDKLLEYTRMVSKDGAYFVLSTPERDALRGLDCMSSHQIEHVREWNTNEFSNYLTSRFFEIIKHRTVYNQRFRPSKKYIAYVIKALQNNQPLRTCQLVVSRVWK